MSSDANSCKYFVRGAVGSLSGVRQMDHIWLIHEFGHSVNAEMACGSQAFIVTLLFDPSIIGSFNP